MSRADPVGIRIKSKSGLLVTRRYHAGSARNVLSEDPKEGLSSLPEHGITGVRLDKPLGAEELSKHSHGLRGEDPFIRYGT